MNKVSRIKSIIISVIILFLIAECAKKEPVTIPVLSTTKVTNIKTTSASSGGTILEVGSEITAKGVCWSNNANPSILDSKTMDGVGSVQYVSNISGLIPGAIYHVRAYATNSFGTAYGNDISFTSSSITYGSVTDIDGNKYKSVVIGNQTWMVENLKTTKYNDGTLIPNLTSGSIVTGVYSDYANNPANSEIYGRLYNWYSVDNNPVSKQASNGGKNVCPTGWHVPSDTEWATLINFVGGEFAAGGKLKEAEFSHWLFPNTGATNDFGFSALPGGYRSDHGNYYYIGTNGEWWSTTVYTSETAWKRNMFNTSSNTGWGGGSKYFGFSVRCVKD